jgi:hypothetical protein
MKNGAWLSTILLFFGLAAGLSPADAQATRTYVSGVGDDANPCSRIAPCRTFAGAVPKTAPFGEINALDPGGFGPVTITYSITIDGGPGIAGVLVDGTNGITVAAGSTDIVHLRNLDINGIGGGVNGIAVTSAGAVQVENVHIYGFGQAGIDFAPTTKSQLEVDNSDIVDNAGDGILIAPVAAKANAVLAGVTSNRNAYGLYVTTGNGAASASGSEFNGNTRGVVAGGGGLINLKSSVVAGNIADGVSADGAHSTVTLSDVGIFKNGVGIGAGGGAVISFGNNQNEDNLTAGSPTKTVSQQ